MGPHRASKQITARRPNWKHMLPLFYCTPTHSVSSSLHFCPTQRFVHVFDWLLMQFLNLLYFIISFFFLYSSPSVFGEPQNNNRLWHFMRGLCITDLNKQRFSIHGEKIFCMWLISIHCGFKLKTCLGTTDVQKQPLTEWGMCLWGKENIWNSIAHCY